jgi:hypothetical protein
LLLGSLAAHAQGTRILIGPSGGDSYDNYQFGVSGGIEQPIGKHLELDFTYRYSPVEKHVALGSGHANLVYGGAYIWLTDHIGLTGRVESSGYAVTRVSKRADYVFGGLAYRAKVGGLPARFTLSYTQQFENGVSTTGLETPHLKGLDFGFSVRLGCKGAVCFRESSDFQFGHVLTQGNPVCDGSYGKAITCPRTGAFGGGTIATFAFEFPRPRGHEADVF